jgi:hypothetical protein
MKLALIPPNCLHRDMARTDFHLILPWQTTELSADFIRSLSSDYVVLDNGAAEGSTYGWNQLRNLAHRLLPQEIVLPDKLRDRFATFDNARQARVFLEGLDFDVNLMAVCQGETLADIVFCANQYANIEGISVIGLPRVLNEQFGKESRVKFAESFASDSHVGHMPIHCLGASYFWPQEMKELAKLPNVRSMDTSMPYVFGYAGMSLEASVPKNGIKRPDNYFGLDYPQNGNREVVEQNVRLCLQWAQA